MKNIGKKAKEDLIKIENLTKDHVKNLKKSRIIYFFIGGVLIFLLEWLLTIILTEIFQINYRISYFISLSLGLIVLYKFHKNITFNIRVPSTIKNYEKFTTLYVVSYILNWIIVSIVSIKINYKITIPLVMLTLGIINFFMNKYWVFKKNE
jgi:putative flippase GtrA